MLIIIIVRLMIIVVIILILGARLYEPLCGTMKPQTRGGAAAGAEAWPIL